MLVPLIRLRVSVLACVKKNIDLRTGQWHRRNALFDVC